MLALKQSKRPWTRRFSTACGSEDPAKTESTMKTAGYSGTPLARKLGIKDNCRLKLIHQPPHYVGLLADLPPGVRIVKDSRTRKDVIHYFAENPAGLEKEIKRLKEEMGVNGALWISWPKKSSGRQTDLDENLIRDVALKAGLVDVKVCAIDEVWSGLKLVIRLKDRGGTLERNAKK